jgi:predicted transcriptional regulator
MSNENSTLEEKQSQEEPQQQALTEAIEEVKGTIKPSTRAIRLATISRLLDKHTTQLDKVGQKFQPLQTQMDRISKLIQPIQKQLTTIEKQTDLIKQIQSQLKQLQKQVSEVQRDTRKSKLYC